jgi:hypothetical protein
MVAIRKKVIGREVVVPYRSRFNLLHPSVIQLYTLVI